MLPTSLCTGTVAGQAICLNCSLPIKKKGRGNALTTPDPTAFNSQGQGKGAAIITWGREKQVAALLSRLVLGGGKLGESRWGPLRITDTLFLTRSLGSIRE